MNNQQLAKIILDKIAFSEYKGFKKWSDLKGTFGFDRQKQTIEKAVLLAIKETKKAIKNE